MELESMAYVAADPTQPGAAWAACSAQARFAKENAKDIASWLKNGAVVMLVTNEVARDMMLKWVRPSDAQRCLKFEQPNPPATPDPQAQ